MFTTKNLIALPLLHFSQSSIAIFQYTRILFKYCNLLQYFNKLQFIAIQVNKVKVWLWYNFSSTKSWERKKIWSCLHFCWQKNTKSVQKEPPPPPFWWRDGIKNVVLPAVNSWIDCNLWTNHGKKKNTHTWGTTTFKTQNSQPKGMKKEPEKIMFSHKSYGIRY